MSDEVTPVDEQPLPEQPTDPKEDPPTDPPPIDPPANPPTDPPVDPPSEPKRKIQVQLKGGIGPMVEIEEDAKVVELPVSEFEEVVPPTPEVWGNITNQRIAIVNNGKALAVFPSVNKPIAFLLREDEKYVWVDDALQVQQRQPPA